MAVDRKKLVEQFQTRKKLAEGGTVDGKGSPQDPAGQAPGWEAWANTPDGGYSEDVGHGFPGGGAQQTAAPWEYVQAGQGVFGLLKKLVGTGIPVAVAKRAVAAAAKPGAALGGKDLAAMTKEDILAHFGEPEIRIDAIMEAPERNAMLQGTANTARLEKVNGAIRAAHGDNTPNPFRSGPTNVSGKPGPGGSTTPRIEGLIDAKRAEALGPPASFARPDEVTSIAPGRAPVAAPGAASGKVPVAPGQAPHPDGYSPSEVVSKQKALLDAYFKAKGVKKYAFGGPVAPLARAPAPAAARPAGTAPRRPWGFGPGYAEGGKVVDFGGKASYEPLKPGSDVPEYIPFSDAVKVTEDRFPGSTTTPFGYLQWLQHDDKGQLVRSPEGLAFIRNPDHPATQAEAQKTMQRLVEAKERATVADDGMAHGGTVADDGGEACGAAADALHRQYFAVGGVVPEPRDPRLDIPATAVDPNGHLSADATLDPKKIVGVDLHPVTIDEQIPHAALVQPVPPRAPDQEQLDRVATQAAEKAEGPSVLDGIERQRRADLEDANPGTAKTIGRAIAGGLEAFGHRQVTDFAAGDKARRDEINGEADRRRKTYLGQPAEELERQGAQTDSAASQRLRDLVGKVTGDPALAAGMSALEVRNASALYQQFLQGKITAQELRIKMLGAQETHDFHNAQLGQGAQKIGIDQQNADTARINAERERGKGHDEAAQKVNQMLAGARGLPDYRNAREAIRNIDSALLLASKPHLSPQEVELVAGELGKVSTGGSAPEGLVKMLSAPTLEGKVAQAKQYLTGRPGDAGYDAIMRSYAHYLKALRANNLRVIVGTQREIVEPVRDQVPEIYGNLARDPMYYENVRNNAAESVPLPADDGSDANNRRRGLEDLGGHIED